MCDATRQKGGCLGERGISPGRSPSISRGETLFGGALSRVVIESQIYVLTRLVFCTSLPRPGDFISPTGRACPCLLGDTANYPAVSGPTVGRRTASIAAATLPVEAANKISARSAQLVLIC